MLNCKKGDIAVTRGFKFGPNVGKIVTCLELLPPGSEGVSTSNGWMWKVDSLFEYVDRNTGISHGFKPIIADSLLQPLRGDLSGDEDLYATPAPPKTVQEERV